MKESEETLVKISTQSEDFYVLVVKGLTKAGGDRGGAILSQGAGRIGGIGKVVI